jgi:MFS family permease
MIVIGISASFFSNYVLLGTGDHAWRWMLAVQVIPAALYFTLLLFVPESPRWLLMKRRDGEALQVLARVVGEREAQANLRTIRESLLEKPCREAFAASSRGACASSCSWRSDWRFFQQITGINAVFYYLPTIFAQTGGGLNDAFGQAVIVGLVNLGMTFVAIWLIDRLGRRPLLIAGITGMAISLLVISWAFGQATMNAPLVLIAIIGFVASFAISLGR